MVQLKVLQGVVRYTLSWLVGEETGNSLGRAVLGMVIDASMD